MDVRSTVVGISFTIYELFGIALGAAATISAIVMFSASSEAEKSVNISDAVCEAFSKKGADTGAYEVWIHGGKFFMGSDTHYPEERSAHEVSIAGFWIDSHEVTNTQFTEFVDETGYLTVAERQPRPQDYPDIPAEMLEPGAAVFFSPVSIANNGDITQWWRFVPGASWRHPEGPGSSIDGRENHPVVQVAYEDALAYAIWKGRALPTEAQWEFAALGGAKDFTGRSEAYRYKDGKWTANTWQGVFPIQNSKSDGYEGTAPVGCFTSNGYGLYDMIGNVWEITADRYKRDHDAMQPASGAPVSTSRITIKGGSFLCAENFCARYRPTARQPQDADLGASHIGFRTVRNVK